MNKNKNGELGKTQKKMEWITAVDIRSLLLALIQLLYDLILATWFILLLHKLHLFCV